MYGISRFIPKLPVEGGTLSVITILKPTSHPIALKNIKRLIVVQQYRMETFGKILLLSFFECDPRFAFEFLRELKRYAKKEKLNIFLSYPGYDPKLLTVAVNEFDDGIIDDLYHVF